MTVDLKFDILSVPSHRCLNASRSRNRTCATQRQRSSTELTTRANGSMHYGGYETAFVNGVAEWNDLPRLTGD